MDEAILKKGIVHNDQLELSAGGQIDVRKILNRMVLKSNNIDGEKVYYIAYVLLVSLGRH